jgi:hypothetical protein
MQATSGKFTFVSEHKTEPDIPFVPSNLPVAFGSLLQATGRHAVIREARCGLFCAHYDECATGQHCAWWACHVCNGGQGKSFKTKLR